MSRNSLYVIAGRSMPTTRKSKVHVDGSGSSYHNDENRYVDDQGVDLVETLEGKRNSVIRLMNDAEEKQFKDQSVKKWVVNIKHALYDANALLDKIDTEKRFREKYKEDGSHDEGFVQWATSEINMIIKKLKDMVKEAGVMGLKARDEGAAASAQQIPIPNDRITSSELSESTIVYDREEQKTRILEQVLSSPAAPGNKPEVIAIVGMGGLGKTTIAQYVYNHADVKSCFTRSWACVSDNFDLVRVTQDILESLLGPGPAAGVRGLAPLQLQLKEQLTRKRFLVVLDDAWDYSWQNWEKLMASFSTGATGSKIILTTRDKRVADVVPADHSFQLEPMSEDEAWSLFTCEVFRDGELSQHPKLEAIGKEIVKKCGGSPLAINTLSGLLRSERKEVEWERVRASSLWQLPEGQKDIIPALGLSYSYLPSHLKKCFAYCSLFPKDYGFSKKELVNLWVDEGFLHQPNDNRSIEDVGVASFDDLSSRSFFIHLYAEEEEEDVYVMHDLIHDLAQMVFADFHLQLNGHKAVKECKKVRHISFHDHSECGSSSILEDLNQAESVQTFMGPRYSRWGLDYRILEGVLLQQLSLRVLCLRGARIRTLPDTISNLKQLRCLDVSYCDVEELPASLCKLYNLRRLLCKGCDGIKEFHYDMAALVSLRHFTLSGRQLQKAPWNLSQVSQVQLEFYLPYSSGSRAPKEGSVHVTVNIDRSTFRFETRFDGSTYGKEAFGLELGLTDLLESSRPHRDVKEVRIRKFTGTEFPGWLVDRSYRNIEKVELFDCQISSGLMPALGGVPSLKHLRLEGVRKVKKFNSTVRFGLLEELLFEDMKEWEEWEPSDAAAAEGGICFFPRLRKLSIENCPKLKGRLPSNLPSLEELHVEGMEEWEEWEPSDAAAGGGICFFPRLRKLSIVDCPKLKGRLPSNLPSLEELRFENMKEWEEWELSDAAAAGGGICFFPRLQKLHLSYCPKLKGRMPSNLPSLKELHIDWCSRLVGLNGCHRHRQVVDLRIVGCGPRLANSCLVHMRLGMFPHLRRLSIVDCDSFESFPVEDSLPTSLTYLEIWRFTRLKKLDVFRLRSLTNLETLVIHDCPSLESLGYSSDVDDCSSDYEFTFNSSLRELYVSECVNLKIINGAWLRSFTSLEKLEITDCNELKVLPVKLPCSLHKLILCWNHPNLKERCKKNTGPDWPNIAHVPDIDIW